MAAAIGTLQPPAVTSRLLHVDICTNSLHDSKDPFIAQPPLPWHECPSSSHTEVVTEWGECDAQQVAGLKKEEDDISNAETPAAPSRFAAAVQDSVAAQEDGEGCANANQRLRRNGGSVKYGATTLIEAGATPFLIEQSHVETL